MAACRVVGVQFLCILLLSGLGVLAGVDVALSALTGGMIGLAGSVWMAVFIFAVPATRPVRQIVFMAYLGEIGKILFMATLLVVAFRQLDWLREGGNALVLFGAFAASQLLMVVAGRALGRPYRAIVS